MADPEEEAENEADPVNLATAQQAGTDDAASPKEVRRKARRTRSALRVSADFWQAILSTPEGRSEVWALLKTAHPFETIFGVAGGFPQAEASWLHAGRQGAGFDQWLHLMALAPEQCMIMVLENEPRVGPVLKALSEKPRPVRAKGASQPPR